MFAAFPVRLLAVALSITLASAALGADDAVRSFDLPAADAADALRQFSQQSGTEVMFLSGSLGGITTAPVRGTFTVREALDRMVAGTELTVAQDAQSGAFAVTRLEVSGRVVRLPPFVVTATLNPHSWQYVAMPGFEILSCCDTRETEQFLDQIYRQQAWLNEIVPPALQARQTVPTALILFSADIKNAIPARVAGLGRANAAWTRARLGALGVQSQPPAAAGVMAQIKLWDQDSTAVDLVLGSRQPGGYGRIGFEPDYVFFLLARQAPPLPVWFMTGVLDLYQERLLPARRIERRFGTEVLLAADQVFRPIVWISPAITRLLAADSSLPRSLLPVGKLLREPPPAPGTDGEKRAWLARLGLPAAGPGDGALDRTLTPAQMRLILMHAADPDSPWRRDLWRSEALLFVRWALDDDTYALRTALWQVASYSHPVTAPEFTRSFGFGFADVRVRLDRYLPRALGRALVLFPETPLEIPWMELGAATESEEARILGDWQRKEFEFIKASNPRYAEAYAGQAGDTFARAYGDGVRDPDFLAAMGIYACTVGDDAQARELLEAAVRAGVARPRAYVELARLRYDEAVAKPGGRGGRLDAAQVGSVLGLLRAGCLQLPPQLTAYLLAAEVWAHSAAPPAPSDRLMLDEGVRFFPNDLRLRNAVAQLEGK